jgi:ubiquinone biosynthesis protein COQ4
MGALQRKYFEIRGLIDFAQFVRDPLNTERIFKMNLHLQKSASPELIEKMLANIFNDPQMEADFQNGYWPQMPTFDECAQMPDGSFGREYASFIERWNLDKDLFPKPILDQRNTYLLSRVYQAHDAWHVLTGYTTSLEDEMALQAFGVAQYRQPLSLLIMSGGVIHLLKTRPEKAEPLLEKISEGFTRGRQAKNLLTARSLEMMALPLEEVRAALRIPQIVTAGLESLRLTADNRT